ncbi:putative inner membrane protein [Pseudobythopirellula maris]|uniref:Putative inner membrane protein n=1 Tax=Pseudobythopirellula maris TaxID=2527991 RepID=A0A5C5ZRD3_9BACT|nr:AI-2E family transporter [Pseudobythopirellula maris]TWT90112.1 putative inner membrane protein [Pseudobythopirellula maris]
MSQPKKKNAEKPAAKQLDEAKKEAAEQAAAGDNPAPHLLKPGVKAETDEELGSVRLGGLKGLPRVVSLLVLVAVVLLIGMMFFRVMAGFLVPLFLAAVLVVVFQPLHDWVKGHLPNRPRLSALATTLLITLIVIGPSVWLGWNAYRETETVVSSLLDEDSRRQLAEKLGGEAQRAIGWYQENVDASFNYKETIGEYTGEAASWVGALGLLGVQTIFAVVVGTVVMIIGLYYFFADGPKMLTTLMRLSPLDDDYEKELFDRFVQVSRAVVVATLLSAVVQGLLAGPGYYFAFRASEGPAPAEAAAEAPTEDPDSSRQQSLPRLNAAAGNVAPSDGAADGGAASDGDLELEYETPIFLLTVLTIVLAVVPFLGAASVWVPVSLWIFFVQPNGFWPGIVLAIYGFAIVSTSDNLIKPIVLHGQSNLHPLLALLSVLGGIQVLGPIGILVGPMLVAFLQALLEMLRREMEGMHAEESTAAGNAV